MVTEYLIDGIDLLEGYNIRVIYAEGINIIPSVKEREQHDWPDESGLEIDPETELVYSALNIVLNCVVIESSYSDAIKRINGLILMLSGSGYHLLGSISRQKLYPVLYQGISDYKLETKIFANPCAIRFQIKLLCPQPELRMGSATVQASGQVSIDPETGKQAIIFWGDGSNSSGIGELTHTYTNAGTYTILVAGTGVTASVLTTTGGVVIDEYSYPASGDIQHINVSHTSEQVWNELQALKDEVPEAGNTLKKLYDLIVDLQNRL